MRTIRDLRREAGDLSQEEVAHRASISTQTYHTIENGLRTPLRLTVASIARVLGVSTEELWTMLRAEAAAKEEK